MVIPFLKWEQCAFTNYLITHWVQVTVEKAAVQLEKYRWYIHTGNTATDSTLYLANIPIRIQLWTLITSSQMLDDNSVSNISPTLAPWSYKHTLMCKTPSYWKHFSSISALIFKGWGVIRLLMFFMRASFTSSVIAGATLIVCTHSKVKEACQLSRQSCVIDLCKKKLPSG
jgi:hypothetical protein